MINTVCLVSRYPGCFAKGRLLAGGKQNGLHWRHCSFVLMEETESTATIKGHLPHVFKTSRDQF